MYIVTATGVIHFINDTANNNILLLLLLLLLSLKCVYKMIYIYINETDRSDK